MQGKEFAAFYLPQNSVSQWTAVLCNLDVTLENRKYLTLHASLLELDRYTDLFTDLVIGVSVTCQGGMSESQTIHVILCSPGGGTVNRQLVSLDRGFLVPELTAPLLTSVWCSVICQR